MTLRLRSEVAAAMRAVIVRRPGGVEALKLAAVPTPEPARGQLRVRVHAAAVNPVDLATRSGELGRLGLVASDRPLALGWDVAGVVDAVGPGVEGFAPRDAVIGLRDVLSAPVGAQAEHVVLGSAGARRCRWTGSLHVSHDGRRRRARKLWSAQTRWTRWSWPPPDCASA